MGYKKILFFLFFFRITIFFSQGVWVQKANLDSFYIQQAVGFGVNGKGYSVGGPDCYAGYAKQVLEYDPVLNTWTRLADFPGIAISGATGFSIGDFGYVLTGQGIGPYTMSKELWEFNPFTKTWLRKADLPGPGRCDAFSFAVKNKGYIGTGYNSGFNRISDFWEWDQASNTWSQKASFPGNRSQGNGFSIDTKGYAGMGSTDSMSCSDEMYEYDPALNTWVQIPSFPGGCSSERVALSICDKGYVGTGLYYDPFGWYEYSPNTNTWIKMTDVPGPVRKDALAFTIDKKAFVGAGAGNPNCLNDFYEFTSSTTFNCNMTGIPELGLSPSFKVFPNPFVNSTTIFSDSFEGVLELRDITGILLKTYQATGNSEFRLERESLSNGIYFLSDGKSKPFVLVVTN